MDPDMMKMAMDAMSKMTPQQMAAMQQQMSSIPQSVLQEQMRNIQNLTPEQKRMAAQQAQHFDPSTLPSQTSQFAANAGQTAFAEANSLKREGNRLHGLGQYNTAVSKYEAASQKLQGVASPEARALVTACKLNMASCYLNTGMNGKCIQQCTEVLQGDANSLKALFRRGQALLSQKSYKAAVADLCRAVGLASSDERPTIQAILDKALAAIPEMDSREAVSEAPSSQMPTSVEEPGSPTEDRSMDGEIEDVDLTAEAASRTAQGMPSASASDRGMPFGQGNAVEDMMRNPETMRTMQNMMSKMKPEDMEAIERQARSMNVNQSFSQHEQMAAMMSNPETMRAMQNVMAGMKPEDMEAMQKQAQRMNINHGASQQDQVAALMKDSEAMKAMQGVMGSMKPEDMAAVQTQAGGVNDSAGSSQQEQMATMMQDPGTMKMMQNMMSNMKPEDMAALQKQAAGFQGGLGSGSQAEQMQAMMNNPDTMKAVQSMMSSMEPSDLAAMYRQAGMNISDEQAAQMAGTMQKMSPEQMAKLIAAANYFQRAYLLLKKYKGLVISLVILFIGILWRLFSR